MSAIVSIENARGNTPTSDVALRIMDRLRDELVGLVGADGFDVMVARALVLARRAYPSLAGVTAGAEGKLTGIEALADQEAAISVVAQFIELLSVLIGEELAIRLILNVWPVAVEEEE